MAAMTLLIYNALEAIQFAYAILDFTILAEYVLHNHKMLCYIEHALYMLEKTKIAFRHQRPIDSKLCWPTFNYPKFYAMSHFVQYIWDYNNTVNYNIAYNKVAHKYFFKVFYNKTNKKEHNLQIRQHNVYYTNIIEIKDVIIIEKAKKKKRLSKGITNTTTLAELSQASSLVDFAERYMLAISNADLDAAKKLGLTGIKKHWKHAGQVKLKLDWLDDWIPSLATFVGYSCRMDDNKEVTKSIKFRQDIDPE